MIRKKFRACSNAHALVSSFFTMGDGMADISPVRKLLQAIVSFALLSSIVLSLSCTMLNPSEEKELPLDRSQWVVSEQNQLLGRGINLGNALDAPVEGEWGVTLQEKYFTHVKELGFASVRIPVRWSAHCQNTAPYTIDETFMKRVTWAVDLALKNNLRVIVNIHHFEDLMKDPLANKAVLLALWKQIGEQFSHYGPELYFELCNEPMNSLTPQLWNEYAAEALAVVREQNPVRSVLIGPGLWNSVEGLSDLSLPADSFCILTVHYYKPDMFTHQGASWVEGSESWKGTKWRGQERDTTRLISHFDLVDAWAKSKGVPVNLGEFGVFDSADALSRALYTSFVAKQATRREWSYHYWKYNADFGIYNDSTDEDCDYLVHALLSPASTFDSCLALVEPDTASEDPGSAQFVIIEDCEDTHLLQNNLATLYIAQHGTVPDSSFCWWSVWYNDSSSVLSNKGTAIYSWEFIDSTDAEPNFNLLTIESDRSGKCLYAKVYLLGGNYPFVGLGTTFPGAYGKDWFDFSDLTAISFLAKGSGFLRVDVITDTVLNGYTEADNWGTFGCDFVLTPEWKQFVVPVKNLTPKRFSLAAKDKLTWSDGMKKACNLSFGINQEYGKVVNDSVEIYLDDIRLYGLTEETFGLNAPSLDVNK